MKQGILNYRVATGKWRPVVTSNQVFLKRIVFWLSLRYRKLLFQSGVVEKLAVTDCELI